MSRDVEFQALQDFLTELAVDAAKVDDKTVRCCVAHQQRNQGVADVFIRASFTVNNNRRHVAENVGELWAGGGGEHQAGEVMEAIEATCAELGLEVRGGEFV